MGTGTGIGIAHTSALRDLRAIVLIMYVCNVSILALHGFWSGQLICLLYWLPFLLFICMPVAPEYFSPFSGKGEFGYTKTNDTIISLILCFTYKCENYFIFTSGAAGVCRHDGQSAGWTGLSNLMVCGCAHVMISCSSHNT